MDGMRKAPPKERRCNPACRQAGFNHYIPVICILIGLYTVTIPVMPKAMELVTLMSPHFVKMSAFIGGDSAVMISSSACHFIAKLIMMETS